MTRGKRPISFAAYPAALACLFLAYAAGSADLSAPTGRSGKPPGARADPVTDTYYGTKVTDPYRYMEDMGSETVAWIQAQGMYARSVLDAIKRRAIVLKEISQFAGSFGFISNYQSFGGRAFYEERAPGSDNLDLVTKDRNGARKIVDMTAWRTAHGGKPFAINFFRASFDGAKVAVGISEGGSENAFTYVYDASSGAQIAGPLARTQAGILSWSPDSKSLYVNQLAETQPGDPPTAKYQNSTVGRWDLDSGLIPVLGTRVGHGPRFDPSQLPSIIVPPNSSIAVAVCINGVQNELELWLAPVDKASDAEVVWTKLASRSDEVTSLVVRRDEIFLLSHHGAPTFKVLAVHVGQNLLDATTLVPAQSDRVIESIHAASDALYVVAREGVYSHLLRIAAGTAQIEEVPLPVRGDISSVFTDPRRPGVTITEESWIIPPTNLSYDPESKTFTNLELGTQPRYDASRYEVLDLEAKAHDGVAVPLTLVERNGTKGPQIVLMSAYGAYGRSDLPRFSSRFIVFMRNNAATADCHVRGGGELGDTWRLAGKDANKRNSWQDLIACSEDLIARGVTTKDKLFLIGTSAGGIVVGRALTERPDLFAGVIDLVPLANTLRIEFSVIGPANIPEFGTVNTEQGFKNLYEMDSLQHVKSGTHYPAVLITAGINDPRVPPWVPAKFAASLQAAGSAKPVLLRVDADAGHGVGSTKRQVDELFADICSFVFWLAGRTDWTPASTSGVN